MTQDTAAASEPAVPSTGEAIESILNKLQGWLDTAIEMLPNLVLAIVLIALFWWAGKVVRRTVTTLLGRAVSNAQIVRLVARLSGLLVVISGFFVALSVLGLNKTVTTFLAGAGVVGLALGFAFQDTAENFISGVLMALRHPFTTGDLVEANGVFGVVESTNLRSTILRRLDGPRVLVPNSKVFKDSLTNYHGGRGRRVDVDIGVSYADDLEEARELALDAVRSVPGRDEDREPECFWGEFGGSSINGIVRFWIPEYGQASFLEARSSAIIRVKQAFDEAGVTIPFPIRTLDFGIEGGTPLHAMLGSGRGEDRPDAGAQ